MTDLLMNRWFLLRTKVWKMAGFRKLFFLFYVHLCATKKHLFMNKQSIFNAWSWNLGNRFVQWSELWLCSWLRKWRREVHHWKRLRIRTPSTPKIACVIVSRKPRFWQNNISIAQLILVDTNYLSKVIAMARTKHFSVSCS